MNMMKWLFSVVLSFGLLVGCSQNESKSEQKAISKTEQKEKLKQEEKKEESKPEEQQESVEKKQQEELQKDNQEQKSQEQPEIKNEEKKEQEPVAQQKQQGQTKAQQEQPEPAKAPEAKEEAKVVNQPKETPKQEQQKDPKAKETTQGGDSVSGTVIPSPVPSEGEGKPDPVPPPKPEEKQVTISVHGDQGYLLGAKKVDMQEGTTVFDVLKNTGLEIDSTGSGNSKYIKGINDLYEFDKGPKSGWKYRVNGTFPNRSAGAYKVKPGDKIEWVYVLN
ncbi:DUF4430 domain-containing protein [Bacillus pseudomycoides]|uniref:DUF4430 domain-containing protein n=1 Tax=Bacillus TaxID=1386 RepID=UPI000367B0BB|nr:MULTISPECIES: DUF4430 domain-containing protein [Bacillus]AIK39268.1 hypothetical protein DJ92_298 [Bacillus pseudomycoides]AJI18085.1 hypothetical protein BG07_4636 [Bacillus pseudomycoides]MCX2824432.1 DUF4430 domain-containing protein [Bacillus sp. DHT2]MDR4915832.1 DUF4430 domain-containing protein [Bacillus pseudomycoides]PDX97761.1 DUF4430 domain-containing protein [Bacillus pseudomycoides]